MKFSELPVSCCFAVLNPNGSSQLMVKTSKGEVRDYMEFKPVEQETPPDTLVQQIHVKKPSQ